MSATSINIQPVKVTSEIHNFRKKKLTYVRSDLSHHNQAWSIDSISTRLASIKERYQKTTGQTMQKKATPIREGVIVIDARTDIDQLRSFSARCEERFGIKAFQIHIHKDEGHTTADGDWKANLHAHIVFDWTQESGRSIKLNRQDMAEMQTILAETLGMKRGKSSDREHLNAIQFKAEQEAAKIKKLQKEAQSIETKKTFKKAIFKTSERILDFVGISVNDKEKVSLMAEKGALKDELEAMIAQNSLLKKELKKIKSKLDKAINENKRLQDYTTAIMQEVRGLGQIFKTERQEEYIKNHFPSLHKIMGFKKRSIGKSVQDQKRDKSMRI